MKHWRLAAVCLVALAAPHMSEDAKVLLAVYWIALACAYAAWGM